MQCHKQIQIQIGPYFISEKYNKNKHNRHHNDKFLTSFSLQNLIKNIGSKLVNL